MTISLGYLGRVQGLGKFLRRRSLLIFIQIVSDSSPSSLLHKPSLRALNHGLSWTSSWSGGWRTLESGFLLSVKSCYCRNLDGPPVGGTQFHLKDGALAPLLVKQRILCRQSDGRYGKAVLCTRGQGGGFVGKMDGRIAQGFCRYDAFPAVAAVSRESWPSNALLPASLIWARLAGLGPETWTWIWDMGHMAERDRET